MKKLVRQFLSLAVVAIMSASVATAQAAPVAPLTLADLARAYAASQAMERGGSEAPHQSYRAGRFDGYLVGLAESLQAAGQVCIPGCMCEIRTRLDPLLDLALVDPALDLQQAATPWLSGHLRAIAPCSTPAR